MGNYTAFLQELYANAQAVKVVATPLFSASPIVYLEYARVSLTGELIALSSHPKFSNAILERRLSFNKAQFDAIEKYSFLSSHYIPESFDKEKYGIVTHLARENFMIDNFFCMVKTTAKYNELFVFGSERGSNCSLLYYMNNMAMLENFVIYFKEKIHPIFKKVKTVQIENFNTNAVDINHNRKYANPAFNLKALSNIDVNGVKGTLNRNEIKILFHLRQGDSAKKIASKLYLSQRTVEDYIARIKIRFSCSNKNHLIDCINQSDILNQLDLRYFI